jgi:hypothetical protein
MTEPHYSSFIIPLKQVTPASGCMTAKSDWHWGAMRLEPDHSNFARMNFSGHPDGDVYIIFHTFATQLPPNDVSPRFFEVFCGTNGAKLGIGYMLFDRNFQVFFLFDSRNNQEDPIWFFGDLDAMDANGRKWLDSTALDSEISGESKSKVFAETTKERSRF